MPPKPRHQAHLALMRLMIRVLFSCRDATRLISEGMDRDLPFLKRLSLRLHLSLCTYCRRYEKQLRLLRAGAGRYADPAANDTDKSLSPAARDRIQKAIRDRANNPEK